jgi:THO complex subunit 5
LSSSSLLLELFPGDTGLKSPNPANAFQMKKIGLDADSFDIHADSIGLPYKWAQWIAGLDFLADNPVQCSPSLSANKMEVVVEALKQRIESRLMLQKQISQLDDFAISELSKTETLFPPKVKSKLVSWKCMTQEEAEEVLSERSERTVSMVRPIADYYYKADVQHSSAKLMAVVGINVCYPTVPPLFIVSVSGESGPCTSDNDLNIKVI